MRALRPAGQTRPRPRPRPGAGRTQVVVEEVQEHQHGAAHDHEDAGHDGRHVHRLVLLLVRPVVTLVLHVPPGEAQAGGGAQPASQLGAPRAADAGRDGEVALRGTAHYLLRGPAPRPPPMASSSGAVRRHEATGCRGPRAPHAHAWPGPPGGSRQPHCRRCSGPGDAPRLGGPGASAGTGAAVWGTHLFTSRLPAQ